MQSVGSFANKQSIHQYLSTDGTTVKIEGQKIKKKSCLPMFKAINSVPTVTVMELRSCRLKKLPAEVSILTQLRVLKIEDNLLQEIPPLEALSELVEVSFSMNQLKLFPNSLVKLEKLTTLDLSHNPIACIPGAVSQLSALTALRIDETALPYFPVSICPLPQLEELRIGGNKFGNFPEQLLQFYKLHTLTLANNNMNAVSAGISKLAHITHLDFSYNNITTVPKELCTMVALQTLHLQHNKLTQLPVEIGNLTNLTSLKLHDNSLANIPDTIGHLTGLVELYLQENELSTLPGTIGTCTSIKTLRLAYNRITSIPDSLSRVAKLNVLMLHDNFLAEIPRALMQPYFIKHLLRVTLHNNPFAENIQNDITTMGALHFLQENFAETSPTFQRKQFRDRGRNPSRNHLTRAREHNRVPGLKSSTGSGTGTSGESNDSSPDDERKAKDKDQVTIASLLKVQARSRRAISVGEALPPSSGQDSDSDSGDERPWKSQMEIRIRSGSVPNGAAPIPPYRSFSRVYEYLVDQLDLSEKRKEAANNLSHEDKWKLLSNLSRESSLNLLVNTKPKSAPGTPPLNALNGVLPNASAPGTPNSTRSPNLPALSLLAPPGGSPQLTTSPSKSPRQPAFLSPALRSPSVSNLQVPRYNTDNIRGTRELLTTQSVAWITTFAETGGIEHILHGLESLSTKKTKTDEDHSMILEYLSCITIMIGIGLESLLISNAVEIVVQNIDSDHGPVKEATIYVLDEVCNVFFSGQGLVIDALTKKCKDESKRFLPLCGPLSNPNSPLTMKAACLKLINNLITNTDELEARCHIRNNFLNLGLQAVLMKLQESSGDEFQRLEQQITHFDEVMKDDGEEIALRFKEGQVDLKNLPLLARFASSTNLRAAATPATPPLRVVLPSVSHTHMSCMVAQHTCDANTTARDVIVALITENGKAMGLEGDYTEKFNEYGLYVVPNAKSTDTKDAVGHFLTDKHLMLPLAQDSSVILDLRLHPWKVTITVDKVVYDLLGAPAAPKAQGPSGVKPLPSIPETQIEVEPATTCGALMLQVLRKLFGDKSYEMEELSFFMQVEKKVPDRNNKAASNNSGTWLESTARLSDYGNDVAKTKLQLKKMPKTLKIIINDDSFEYVAYDEDTPIRAILQDTFTRFVAPSLNRGNSPSHYGLFYLNEETGQGEWLDAERILYSYEFPHRVPLRYLIKPKKLNINYNPPATFKGNVPKFTNPQLINFYAPIADMLAKMGFDLEGCGVYLVNESGDQMLDANLSLFNQNVPENSTVLIKVATKAEAQLAASVHIWEEPENATTILYNVDNFNEIHAATVNKLVERLTSEKDHDQDFTQVFEATYRTFVTHETLFAKLVERYIPPDHIPEPPALNVVRLRVIVFLKNWLEHSGKDLPQALMLSIEKFIDNQLCKGGHMSLAAPLKKMIQNWKNTPQDSPREAPDLNYSMSNPTKIIHGFSSLVDEWGLALAMTIRESKLFSQIKPVEFFTQKANDPTVAHMINNFNRVAAWVPIAVLSEIKLVHRANAVERFIKLAWNLRQLNNFHLLTAVLSGLSNSAVLRMKWTFSKVQKRYKQMLEELEDVMAMEGSFKNYRNTLNLATPPCVPYIGVYLTDLVFIEDGNPDKIGTMINWTKRRLMYNIINTFQRYQLSQYDEKLQSPTSPTHSSGSSLRLNENREANINTFLTFLNRMPILSDKQLYEMSMAREPRNCDRRDLM